MPLDGDLWMAAHAAHGAWWAEVVLRPDSPTHGDMITDHAIGLIARDGLASVTFPAVAGRIGVTRQAIQQWLGPGHTLIGVVARTFVQRWLTWIKRRSYGYGALALLPGRDEEVPWTRVLLALEEGGRIDPVVAARITDLHVGERHLLGTVHPELSGDAGEGRVQHLQAVLDGVRVALCRSDSGLTPHQGRHLFWEACQRVAGPQATWLAPYAPWAVSHPCLPASREPGASVSRGS